ncbi:DUF3987 domain-containing protein [Pseudacidovorax sp. RU35E]|uniref:DUF3987 domain-containing protein n=1 Tax=Pseudacidovorax sp. RU35E TaxID=1907403 RepID=UPI00095746B7|nr:DUF3987 domain-containing protein [Pseudacidovorax sp. RU35E]SIR80470.1 Protein of unknown function [Pseudacidovorax sp. RU35E]
MYYQAFTPEPERRPYPVDNFGPKAAGWILNSHRETKIPIETLAANFLGCAAAAAQGSYNVVRPDLDPSPISLITCTIAGSGEGKDTAARPLLKAFQQVEQELDDLHAEDEHEFQARRAVHTAKIKCVKAQMDEAVRNGEDLGELMERHAALSREAPKPIHRIKIVHNDVTAAALISAIAKGDRNVLLHSTEAGGFLNGAMGKEQPQLNAMWDATPTIRERAGQKPEEASDYRVSINLSLQPRLFLKYLKRSGDDAQDGGLFARILFTVPPPTLGTRLLENVYPTVSGTHDPLTARLRALLLDGARRCAEGAARESLSFTADAAAEFKKIYNDFQLSMRLGGEFFTIRPQAAKGAEQVARVAAVLQVIEGTPGQIDIWQLRRALVIVLWHLRQAVALFTSVRCDTVELDAEVLVQAALRASIQGLGHLSVTELRDCARPEMELKRAKVAVNLLVERGQLGRKAVSGRLKLYVPAHHHRPLPGSLLPRLGG